MVFRAAAEVFVPFLRAELFIERFDADLCLFADAEFVIVRSVEGSVVSFLGAEFVVARAESEVLVS